jgi:hypothetical protein
MHSPSGLSSVQGRVGLPQGEALFNPISTISRGLAFIKRLERNEKPREIGSRESLAVPGRQEGLLGEVEKTGRPVTGPVGHGAELASGAYSHDNEYLADLLRDLQCGG